MWQIFLLVSARHVNAHLDRHQDDGSVQISVNLGKKYLCINYLRKLESLARVFAYLRSFLSQILS